MLEIIITAFIAFYFDLNFLTILFANISIPKTKEKIRDGQLVSVIIPTKDDEKVVENTLKKVKESDYKNLEIIVIDASKDDRTRKIAKKYTKKIYIDKKATGKPRALNLGISKAKGELIYILDADCCIEKDTISKLVVSLSEYDAAVGSTIPRNNENFIEKIGRLQSALLNSVHIWFFKITDMTVIPGRNFIIKKKVLEEVDNFSDALTEDVNLFRKLYRKNKKIKYVPDARCEETAPSKIKHLFKQQRRWILGGLNEVISGIKKGDISEIFIKIPFLTIATLSYVGGLLLLLAFLLFWNYVFLLGFITALLIAYVMAFRYLTWKEIVILPITFFALAIFSLIMIADGLKNIILGKEIGWQKTPN